MFDFLIDMLYPPRCAVCRCITGINEPRWLCKECTGDFTVITGEVCIKCGLPEENAYGLCSSCGKKTHALESNYALFLYEGRERELVLNLKYHFGPSVMKFIKKIMEEKVDKRKLSKIDCIVAVPMYKKKEKDRGYNQALLLACTLSEIIGVPVIKNVLERVRGTRAQSSLNYYGRQKNIQGAFSLNDKKRIISSKAILLVDDIYTTGSTMNECAGVLLSGGAKSVNGFTFNVTANKTDIGSDFN